MKLSPAYRFGEGTVPTVFSLEVANGLKLSGVCAVWFMHLIKETSKAHGSFKTVVPVLEIGLITAYSALASWEACQTPAVVIDEEKFEKLLKEDN